MDLNAKAVPQCSEQVDGAGQCSGISQHLQGYESDQPRHHHVAVPSQGRVCPLSGLHCHVPSRKRSHSSALGLTLPQVCSRTLCPKEQTCFCFLWLQIQVAEWEWTCPRPSALLRHGLEEKLGLFSAPSHMVPCFSCLGKVKQSQFCVCEQPLSNGSKELSYQSVFCGCVLHAHGRI